MVDAGEELPDIAFQDVLILPGVVLVALNGFVRAFTLTIGITVINERPLKQRLYDIAYRMMDNPVPKRRCADEALFGVVDVKGTVGAWTVGLFPQLLFQSKQPFLEVHLEGGYSRL